MKTSEWTVSVQRNGRKPDDRDIVFTGSFDSAATYVHVHTCSRSLRNVHACMRSGSFTACGPNGTMFRVEQSKGCAAPGDVAGEVLERQIEELMEEGEL